MVELNAVVAANSQLKNLGPGLVALFGNHSLHRLQHRTATEFSQLGVLVESANIP